MSELKDYIDEEIHEILIGALNVLARYGATINKMDSIYRQNFNREMSRGDYLTEAKRVSGELCVIFDSYIDTLFKIIDRKSEELDKAT